MENGILEYSSNNSGGSFWLKDEDWKALEQAGWVVHWIHDIYDENHEHSMEADEWNYDGHRHSYTYPLVPSVSNGKRWLGALATSAAIPIGDNGVYGSKEEAVQDFEKITGQSSTVEGCPCCGQPHAFSFVHDDGNIDYL